MKILFYPASVPRITDCVLYSNFYTTPGRHTHISKNERLVLPVGVALVGQPSYFRLTGQSPELRHQSTIAPAESSYGTQCRRNIVCAFLYLSTSAYRSPSHGNAHRATYCVSSRSGFLGGTIVLTIVYSSSTSVRIMPLLMLGAPLMLSWHASNSRYYDGDPAVLFCLM